MSNNGSSDQSTRWVLYNSESKLQSIPVNHEEIQWTVMRMKPADWKKYFIWRDGWQNWQPLDSWLRSSQKEIIVDFLKQTGDDIETLTEATATVRVDKFSVEKTPDKQKRSKSSSSSSSRSTRSGQTIQTQKNSTIVDWDDQLARMFSEGVQDFSGDQFAEHFQQQPSGKTISFKADADLKMAKYKNRAERHSLQIEVLFLSSKGKTFKSFSRNISMSGTLLDDELPFEFIAPKFEVVIINRFAKSNQNSRLQLFAKCPIPSAPNRIQFLELKADQKQRLKTLLEQYLQDHKNHSVKAS